MARLDIRLTDEQKQKLIEIADKENRSITKEIIELIEDKYRELMRGNK
jgi:predicted transcriptional regulator